MLTNLIGGAPQGPLIQGPDGTLYGTTTIPSLNYQYGTINIGEGNLGGSIFKIQTNGTGFVTLHTFYITNDNDFANSEPAGGLVLSGNTLYGVLPSGNGYNVQGYGLLFKLNTDGTGYTNFFDFTGSGVLIPNGCLIISGNTLFGTAEGATDANGAIYRVNVDGTGFTNLHSFSGVNSANGANGDGAYPYGPLVLSGNVLYGVALTGGSTGSGTVFKLNTDGSGFGVVYNLSGGLGLAYPDSGLLLTNGVLYATSSGQAVYPSSGYVHTNGTLFKVNTNGTLAASLYSFHNQLDGAIPHGCPVFVNGALYMTAKQGGAFQLGTLAGVEPPGSTFATLHAFTGVADGAAPDGGLLFSGGRLYGAALSGGAGSIGTLFGVNTNGTQFTNLFNFHYSDAAISSSGGLIVAGGTLYGAAEHGAGGNGTLFSINPDGSGFTNFYTFSPGVTNSDGANPSTLTFVDGLFYGAAIVGGPGADGTLFRVTANGTNFTVLHSFTTQDPNLFTNADGANPNGDLVISGDTLYGTTYYGGTNGFGTVFKVQTNGVGFSNVYTFTTALLDSNGYYTNTDGAYPNVGVVCSNNFIYGSASAGGLGGGVVFRVNQDGSGFTNLHSFSPVIYPQVTNADGASPGALILVGTTIYGTTSSGGSEGSGTIWSINSDGTGFTNIYVFSSAGGTNAAGLSTNSDGISPYNLVLRGSALYGTTGSGGVEGLGTIFKIGLDGTGFSNLYNFTGTNGAYPSSDLVISGHALYGAAQQGGAINDGVIFALTLPPPQLRIQLLGDEVILTWDDPTYSLQATSPITGIFSNVTGAASPFTNAITSAQQFFRVRSN